MNFSRVQLYVIAVIVLVLLGLVAAASFQLLSPRVEQAEATPAPALTPVALDPNLSTAGRIVARGKIRVGIRNDVRPFGFINASGQLTGFDVDLTQEFARRWLGDANAVEFVPVTAGDRIPRLLSGDVDLLVAALENRRERDAFIDFSQDYFVGGLTFLVRIDSGITDLTRLQGRIVAVLQDSPALEVLQTLAQRTQTNITLVTYQEYPQAVAGLTASQVDAVIGDSVSLAQFAQENSALQLAGGRLTRQPYAVGLPQGDSAFRELVNVTLQEMKREGVYDALYTRWFTGDAPLALEMTPGEWTGTLPTLPTQLALPAQTRIQTILERGRLIAGVRADLNPFGIRTEGGRLTGFDIDIVREFAHRWLGNPDAVELVIGTPEEQLTRLEKGEIDISAAGLVRQRQWITKIDFSQTYVVTPQSADPYSIGLPTNDATFRELVNVTLQEMKNDGAYDQIFAQWFGATQPPYAVALVPGDADYLLLPAANQPQTALRVSATGESAIAAIRQRNNQLLVGISQDAPLFGFIDSAGQLTGFDVELVQALAQQWGASVQFVTLPAAERIEKLRGGEIDLIAGAFIHSKEREAIIDFSQGYFMAGQQLLVRRDAGINRVADLNNRTVAVVAGSTFGDTLQAEADTLRITLLLQPVADYATAVEAVKTGQVQALSADTITLAQLAQAHPELIVVGELLNQEPYALGVPQDDGYFQQLVNATLQSLKTTGVYEQIYRKWFGADAQLPALESWAGAWPHTLATSPVALNPEVASRIDQFFTRGRLIVGVRLDLHPFGQVDANSQPAGFDVDLVRAFAKRWLGDESAVEFVLVTADTQQEALVGGQVDLLATGLLRTHERAEVIDFSQSYAWAAQGLPYAFGVPRGDDRLRDLVNFTLQEMQHDGSYVQLVTRWFGAAPTIAMEEWPGRSYLRVNVVPMRRIPAGEFVRGNNGGFPDEQPEQTVTLDQFYIDQFEVTNRHYAECVSAGICTLPRLPRSVNYSAYYAQSAFGNFPVTWVSWQDAQNYCQFIGKRLPTEAEWEKAARGGQPVTYPWGNDEPTTQTNFNYLQGDVVAVGAYPGDVNGYGVNDMAGNVREWVADWYQWDYYQSPPTPNPAGPASGVTRVLRGGSWNDIAIYTRTSVRKNYLPDSYDANLGFRCATTIMPTR
jgi:ABC-type amino acid transport substrate-binding protein